MLLDFAEGGQDLLLDADLCVVGGGAVGLTIARELSRSGLRICVLETGGLDRDPVADGLNATTSAGSPTLDFQTTRPRVFGGSTAEWGGMCCPLDECDFETRPSMPLHSWPLSLAELQPHYQRAHAALGLGPVYFDERVWPVLRTRAPAVDRDKLLTKFWQYRSPGLLPTDSPLRFGEAYRAELAASPDVRAVLNATVVEIVRAPGRDTVERVGFRNVAGRRGEVRASAFVLAGGTVENTRLLLASEFHRCSDTLGRYFMEHPHLTVGSISYADMRRVLPTWAALQRAKRVSFRPKFVPTPAYQRQRDILNAAMTLEVRGLPDCPHLALPDLVRGVRDKRSGSELARGVRRLVGHPGMAVSAAYRRSAGRPACPGHGGIRLYCRSEQEPNAASRIELGPDRDAMGIRRAHVSWRLTDRDRRTVVDFAHLVGGELHRLGATDVTLDDWLAEPGAWAEDLRGGPHHSGTTRMSHTAATGVVDRDSRVHGVPNLYVVGPSVFPTGGYANPTYTIIALALRAADHLARELRPTAATTPPVATPPVATPPAATTPATATDGTTTTRPAAAPA